MLYGDILLDKGDYDSAFNYYNKVLEINSSNSSVYVKIGDIYRKKDKDYPKARKYWREALNLNPYLEAAREAWNYFGRLLGRLFWICLSLFDRYWHWSWNM